MSSGLRSRESFFFFAPLRGFAVFLAKPGPPVPRRVDVRPVLVTPVFLTGDISLSPYRVADRKPKPIPHAAKLPGQAGESNRIVWGGTKYYPDSD